MPLTVFQEEVLSGLMLGDGHLSIGGTAKNPRLRINRTDRDEAPSTIGVTPMSTILAHRGRCYFALPCHSQQLPRETLKAGIFCKLMARTRE